MADDREPRCDWTQEEIAQVRETFGAADAPEALALFAPDDWEEFHEIVPEEELLEVLFWERESLRRKATRHRAAAEMGFGVVDAARFGAIANYLTDGSGAA